MLVTVVVSDVTVSESLKSEVLFYTKENGGSEVKHLHLDANRARI